MKVAITGASGFIGSALTRSLREEGVEVLRVSRGAPGPDVVHWDPQRREIERDRLEGVDALVHLAGENLGGRRWNETHKARVLDSRVRGTHLVAETAARLEPPPKVLVTASAIGFYGDRGDEPLTESSQGGAGFLAEVCRQWEQSAEPAAAAGVRVVTVRSGLVLAAHGGILPRILLPFRLGFGGRVGSGRQWWSWITLADEVRALAWCLEQDGLRGAINLTAPNPMRNEDFTRTLAHVLRRPALVPVPAAALKLVLGPEMARDLLLASQRVLPTALLESGFEFRHDTLEGGLRAVLGHA